MRLSQKCKATNWMRQSLPKNYQNPCTKNSEAWKFQEECMKWYMFDVEYAASNVPLHSSAHSQNLVAMLNFGRVIPQTVYALFYYVIINVGVIAYAVAHDCCSFQKFADLHMKWLQSRRTKLSNTPNVPGFSGIVSGWSSSSSLASSSSSSSLSS